MADPDSPSASRPRVGVVIPTRNAAKPLASLLPDLVSERLALDVMVADGGSSDATVDVAARFGARVTEAEGGRGPQMRAGVDAVLGDWIFLLHADSQLAEDWDAHLLTLMAKPGGGSCAGYFRFALDDRSPPAQRLERMVAWRCRTFGLPYGDQGLVLSRDFLDALGGVPVLPLMEDVALARRIGKKRLIAFDADLVTSAEKFRRVGYVRRSAWNLICLSLYLIGVPTPWIRKLYG